MEQIREPFSAVPDSELAGTSTPSVSPPASIDPNNPPWGIIIALLVWFSSVALQLGMSLLLVLPYIATQGFSPSDPEFARKLAEFAATDKTAVFLQILALLPAHLLTLLLVWAIATGFGKRSFTEVLGLACSRFPVWLSVLLGVVLFLLGSGLAKLVGGDAPTQLETIINNSLPTRYLVAFLAVATAPLVEELVYRGVVYSALQRAIGAAGAIVIVLALFTIVHIPQYRTNVGVIMAVGILSVALTLLRAYTGRLLPCVIVHLVFNAVQAVILIFTNPTSS
ncbi:MAG TPA: CPBP family intramembrane glutamic endopeptidase [Pyrinomonadaceae bacterium]|nr:CPBP family intramembrane glutamic endopeptidase [Pyrinomonadaceae bacterium]